MDYLNHLPKKDQAKIRNHLRLLQQFGNQLGPPQAKKLKGKGLTLWELRPMPTRIFYFFQTGRRIILLHAFAKKKDRTDENEIQIALRPFKENKKATAYVGKGVIRTKYFSKPSRRSKRCSR